MGDDLMKRLDNLWSMLDDEGYYTKANTVELAKNSIKQLAANCEALTAERDTLKAEVERLKAMPIFTPDDATRVPEIKALIEAAKALHIDMLERAECRMDTIRGEQYRIVNSGRTAWANFDAALRAITEANK